MGHNTLGVIPCTKDWRIVTNLLSSKADAAEVFSASAAAAERDLLGSADDPVFQEAIRLLLVIPAAAREQQFGPALTLQDIKVAGQPGLLDLIAAVSARLDEVRRKTNRRTDLGDLAGRSLCAVLTQRIADTLPGLFEATPDDVRDAARKLSYANGIQDLTRGFFANLTQATMSYWLERTLADHVGPQMRFSAAGDRSRFDADLGAYAYEATRIIKEFSGGWYAKHLHQKGGFDRQDAAVFGAVCLKKTVSELRRRHPRHA